MFDHSKSLVGKQSDCAEIGHLKVILASDVGNVLLDRALHPSEPLQIEVEVLRTGALRISSNPSLLERSRKPLDNDIKQLKIVRRSRLTIYR